MIRIFHRLISAIKEQAATLKCHVLTVYFAAKDPQMPLPVKLLAMTVVAYALSPIDLIPDFIPVIGYLDDLVIIPLGLALVLRLTPQQVIASSILKAEQTATKPVNYFAAAIFVIIWLVLSGWLASYIFYRFNT